jgi:N-acetylglucosaminyl-diphospho-decaprenol L-rhamnosyltransferase
MIYVLMPVFNRLALTMTMLACLRAQRLDDALRIVVINDGSSDGSGTWLAAQTDLLTLQGDGSLWWGGSIDFGLRRVLAEAGSDDWVLFVNNDTEIDPDFVQRLPQLAV